MSDEIELIADQFNFPSAVGKVDSYGAGIINDTYVVTLTDPPVSSHPRLGKRAILQCINSKVFPDPNLIMDNLAVVLEHAANKAPEKYSKFMLPPIYKTRQGAASFQDEYGNYWRAIGFIENTITSNILKNSAQAREAGSALGAFHQLLADIPADQLHDTLPGFHDTPAYLRMFDTVVKKGQSVAEATGDIQDTGSRSESEPEITASCNYCIEQIEKHRSLAGLLYDIRPAIRTRIMHGDPKLNNFLFDQDSGQAISIIDLDTVKPGIIHYDLGDCVRSCCNKGGEMPPNIEDVRFDVDYFKHILEGYLSTAGKLFEGSDFDLLFDVVRLLPFELAVRFFTDYLNGNQYFKVDSPRDNLYRARVQLQLLDSIETQEQQLRQAITHCRQAVEI